MSKRYSILVSLLLALAIFGLNFNQTNAATIKRVVLEQHTGAWCGWCPDGSYVMDQLIKTYGDKLIGIKMHNGDAMAINEEATVGNYLGLQGFPTGTVDRALCNDGTNAFWFLDRSQWAQVVDAMVKQAPEVDVQLKYTINPDTREITAYVDATFLKAQSVETRLNVVICENGVTGSGAGYDQHNYLSGRAGYESNPYYKQPAVIIGYRHEKVARVYLGGAWGLENSIGSSANTGSKWSYVFSYIAPSTWNLDSLFLVGMVQKYNNTQGSYNFQIMNGIVGNKINLTTTLEAVDAPKQVADQTTPAELNFNLKNISSGNITYSWKLEKSSRTPSDWTASLEGATGDIPVNAGSFQALKIKLAPATLGIGDAVLTLWDKSQPAGLQFVQKLTVVSNEIQKVQVVDDNVSGAMSIKNELANAETGFYDIPSADFTTLYNNMSNLKTVAWSFGEEGTVTADKATAISSLLVQGKNMLISGAMVPYSMSQAGKNTLSYLGINYLAPCYQGSSTGSVNLKGYSGDPITDGFSQSCQLKKYLTFALGISNPNTASPIIRHLSVDTVVAVRSQLDNARAVFIGFNPQIIGNNAARNDLIKKSLAWAEQGGTQTAPKMTLSTTELQYDKVMNTDTKNMKFTITNDGNSDLVISEISMDYSKDVNHVFNFVNLGNAPFTIAPQGTMDVTVKFSPLKKAYYEGDVTIKSNSLNNPDELISLYGEGDEINSVTDATSQNGDFTMTINPNPVSLNGNVNFTLNGNSAKSLKLSLIDISGKVVNELYNNVINPGQGSAELNTSGLSSGSYYLVANLAGELIKLQIKIVK